jgi:hypothetical protein
MQLADRFRQLRDSGRGKQQVLIAAAINVLSVAGLQRRMSTLDVAVLTRESIDFRNSVLVAAAFQITVPALERPLGFNRVDLSDAVAFLGPLQKVPPGEPLHNPRKFARLQVGCA